MATHPRTLPPQGTFDEHPLPRVLLGAWRDAWTGCLEISRERMSKRISLQDGLPIYVESNLARESLGAQLLDSERIGRDDHERLCAYVEQHGVREGAALLTLKLLDPKELFLALRDQVRRRIVDAFGWPDGRFRFSEGSAPAEEAQAFRVDPLAILQHGLATHWNAERLLGDLEKSLARHAVPNDRFEALAARLVAGPETRSLLDDLDPERTFGEAVYRSPSVERLAAAWVLAESGGLDFQDGPPGEDADGGAHEEDGAPEIDFQFEVGPAPGESDAESVGGAEAQGAAKAELPPQAEALRQEIMDKHDRLGQLSHYEMLGVAVDASDAAIKKAYFGLAKRVHPDALGRMGLGALNREANEVFARIAKAYQTLSDPARRSEYDGRRGSGTPSADANRLAQAETLFRKAEVLIKVGNFGSALDFLRPCVELWPDEADYQGALGWALYKHSPSDPDGARDHLERAQKAKPDDPVLCFRLGVVLRKLGEAEPAERLIERAKQLEKG